MDTAMNQGVFLSIPKSDIKFFKELADYIASRPKKVNLSEEEILAELKTIRYEE